MSGRLQDILRSENIENHHILCTTKQSYASKRSNYNYQVNLTQETMVVTVSMYGTMTVINWGNPAVNGYKFITFFLINMYVSNHASFQCTKCVVMLHVEIIHTELIVDEIHHFLSYFPALYANGLHAHRLRTYLCFA